PFRAESGICWMILVDLDLDQEFAAALERATDSVVVWSPNQPELPARLRLRRLTEVIRNRYRLDAQFGRIEIWRRVTSGQVFREMVDSAALTGRTRPVTSMNWNGSSQVE